MHPAARVDGIIVQPMAAPGVEVIVGMSKDATFGPVLMFGLGGVLVEVLKDVTFRIVPLSQRDATEMIHDIKGFPLLAGYRGAAPADLEALQHILLTLSAFVAEHTRGERDRSQSHLRLCPGGAGGGCACGAGRGASVSRS